MSESLSMSMSSVAVVAVVVVVVVVVVDVVVAAAALVLVVAPYRCPHTPDRRYPHTRSTGVRVFAPGGVRVFQYQ